MAVIAPDAAKSRKLYVDALGLPLEASEGDDYFGTPVVVAQRLCDRARGGQVLASALLQGLVGNRAGCSFTTLGDHGERSAEGPF